MIDSLVLQKSVGLVDTYSGLDCPQHAKDKEHFHRYKKFIIYIFNSLGYRDNEWPTDLSNQIWGIGDSFTLGLGQPIEETWPKLVETKLEQRVINVSMNGASNDWIARRACYIINNFDPKAILIQWSYLHRREHPNSQLCDEDRRLQYVAKEIIDPNKDANDIANFFENLNSIKLIKKNTTVIHSFIPKFFDTSNVDQIIEFDKRLEESQELFFKPPPQIDFSRDGHHYDINTATSYADLYVKYFKS
jgi:hypothetical protein